MTDLSAYKYFYFLGIGGIGMSALARYFNFRGFEVAGYDRTPSELTGELEKEGIRIHFEDNIHSIPQSMLNHKAEVLVVYTPAIPKDHLEFNFLLGEGYAVLKRAETLASVTLGKKTIAVAGTHGKTSTACMISHILRTANVPFYAFLGGISTNYHTNFMAPAPDAEAGLVVVEADEFDRSFHRLNPDVAIITAIESDHLDIYGTEENLRQAFEEFAEKLNPGGMLITQVNTHVRHNKQVQNYTYSALGGADIHAEEIKIENGKYYFDAVLPHERLDGLSMGIPGVHNIENSLAAIAATRGWVEERPLIYKALDSFMGVRRRFEVIFKNSHITYIDDYAHHPTEIKATLTTIRALYPGKKLLVVFQPHLYSRTRDLADDFADSLSLADELVLLPIYPAREEPIPGVSADLILQKVKSSDKKILTREEFLDAIPGFEADVMVTLGAGDIDRLVGPVKQFLDEKFKTAAQQ